MNSNWNSGPPPQKYDQLVKGAKLTNSERLLIDEIFKTRIKHKDKKFEMTKEFSQFLDKSLERDTRGER